MRPNLCCLASLLLLLLIGALVLKFLWQGEAGMADDGRTGIAMPAGERDLVLAEMRQFLTSVRAVTAAISEDDPSALAQAARSSGRAMAATMPASLANRLPADFKRLGSDTHRRFDLMALDAEQMGDMQISLQQLAEVLDNCVNCHATYRIDRLTK